MLNTTVFIVLCNPNVSKIIIIPQRDSKFCYWVMSSVVIIQKIKTQETSSNFGKYIQEPHHW